MMKRIMLVGLLVFLGCTQHDDFPPLLDINAPPTPSNVGITTPQGGTYQLTWTVSQPSLVKVFNIYLSDPFFGAQVLAATTQTNFTWQPGVDATGLQLGVSTVSDENVESEVVFRTVPPPPSSSR